MACAAGSFIYIRCSAGAITKRVIDALAAARADTARTLGGSRRLARCFELPEDTFTKGSLFELESKFCLAEWWAVTSLYGVREHHVNCIPNTLLGR